MKKILKVLGIVIVVFVLIIIGFVVFGPSSAYLERSIVIQAPVKEVFKEVNTLKTFNKWSPWYNLDPQAEYILDGPHAGAGSKLTWFSNNSEVGNGFMKIINSENNTSVTYLMGFDQNGNRDFSDEGDNDSKAQMLLEAIDEGQTILTWTFSMEKVSGTDKLFILVLNQLLGPMYEKGLQNLKERIENRPAFSVELSLEKLTPVNFIGVQTSSAPQEIGKIMGQSYGRLMEYIQKNRVQVNGSPLAVYTSYDKERIEMICGIPVPSDIKVESKDEISIQKIDEGLYVKAIHQGNYETLKDTHKQIRDYIDYYGYVLSGSPWESYVTDPAEEKDATQWITHIFYAIN